MVRVSVHVQFFDNLKLVHKILEVLAHLAVFPALNSTLNLEIGLVRVA